MSSLLEPDSCICGLWCFARRERVHVHDNNHPEHDQAGPAATQVESVQKESGPGSGSAVSTAGGVDRFDALSGPTRRQALSAEWRQI